MDGAGVDYLGSGRRWVTAGNDESDPICCGLAGMRQVSSTRSYQRWSVRAEDRGGGGGEAAGVLFLSNKKKKRRILDEALDDEQRVERKCASGAGQPPVFLQFHP